MHVAVCITYIPDPEAPWRDIKLNPQCRAPLLERMQRVAGPFDENALEVALQLKNGGDVRVTALSLGPAYHEEILRRALALRCDAALHLKVESAPELDSAGVALFLGAALRRLGDVDLVLCGRQVGDWDGGQVGLLLSEELGIPCLSLVREAQLLQDGVLRVTMEVPEGVAHAEATLPAVATVTNTARNQLRVPKVKDSLTARRMAITTWTLADLGLPPTEILAAERRVVVERVYYPETRVRVQMIDDPNSQVAASCLADYLLGLEPLQARLRHREAKP